MVVDSLPLIPDDLPPSTSIVDIMEESQAWFQFQGPPQQTLPQFQVLPRIQALPQFQALPQDGPPLPPDALVPPMPVRQQLSAADISSAKGTLATYIRRVLLGKLSHEEAQALEAAWRRRSCGVRELTKRLLDRWPVVQHEAAKHLSLIELASIYPPKGVQLGRLISLDDATLARHVFVEIVGYPDDIFEKLRRLHYLPVERVDEPPRKRGKATGSFAEPVCASSATSGACGSCALSTLRLVRSRMHLHGVGHDELRRTRRGHQLLPLLRSSVRHRRHSEACEAPA